MGSILPTGKLYAWSISLLWRNTPVYAYRMTDEQPIPDPLIWLDFQLVPDEMHDPNALLQSLVFQALGGASCCWTNMSGAGVFESDYCRRIGDRLIEALAYHFPDRFPTGEVIHNAAGEVVLVMSPAFHPAHLEHRLEYPGVQLLDSEVEL